MSYKTMLAYIPNEEQANRVLDALLPLARQHDAHLIGLHVLPRVPMMFVVVEAEIPQSIIAQQEEVLERDAKHLEKLFYERCEKAGVKAEWRCSKREGGELAGEVVSQSLCADLVAVAQVREDDYGFTDDLPARVAIEAGRPTLVIPYTGNFPTIGQRVVVAWNGSREAARAAHYAVPMMKQAQSVRVLAIDPECREGYDSIALGDEMALCLSRHDIKTEATVARGGGVTVGAELLNRLADDNCDLLVMGCYGHSQLRETLFGGVTRNLLAQMTAPVLMAH